MKRCKITVLKITLDKKLAAEDGAEGLGACLMHKAGQVFYTDYAKPGLHPVIFKVETTDEESIINYVPVK